MIEITPTEQIFYAVVCQQTPPRHLRALHGFDPPKPQPVLTKPYILPLICEHPKFTKSGKLATSNKYKTYCYNIHGGGALPHLTRKDIFLTQEEAQAAFTPLQARYDAQTEQFNALERNCTASVQAIVQPLIDTFQQLPAYPSFHRYRLRRRPVSHTYNTEGYIPEHTFFLTPREIALHNLAFPDNRFFGHPYNNHNPISPPSILTYPQTLGFDLPKFLRQVEKDTRTILEHVSRFHQYLQENEAHILALFPQGLGPSQRDIQMHNAY